MARATNREERRSQITAALQRTMAVNGYERSTIAMIAEEAGLASGLVHYHFGSKSEILLALVEGLAHGAESRIDARLARAETPLDQLDAIVDALLARDGDHDADAVRCWTSIAAEAVKSVEVRIAYGAYVERLTDRLARATVATCHAEGRSGEGSRSIAGAIVAMIEGYFALSAAVPTVIPAGSAASMAKRSVRGLIAAQPRKERA